MVGYGAPPELEAADGRVPVPPVERRALPVKVLLRDGGAAVLERLALLPRLRNAHPDALRLGPRRGDARHPHLRLRAGLRARAFGAHSGGRDRAKAGLRLCSGQQAERRVTPVQLAVQDC